MVAIVFGISIFLIAGSSIPVIGQVTEEQENRKSPKYRVARAEYSTAKDNKLLFISVEPRFFNCHDMVAIAKQINVKYPRDLRISAFIFTDHHAAKTFSINSGSAIWNAFRGGYSLDRQTGEEYIRYAPPGNALFDEIKVLLGDKTKAPCAAEAKRTTLGSCDGKFKIVFEARPLGKSDEIGLDVIIKPKLFTVACMNDFVRRVKEKYRDERKISVAIFDSKQDQKGWHYDYATSGTKVDRRRGNYIVDRLNAIDLIEFSTKKGNPLDEVKIDYLHQ